MTDDGWRSFIVKEVSDVKSLLEKTMESQTELNLVLKSYIAKQEEINRFSGEKHETLESRVRAVEILQSECPGRRIQKVNDKVLLVLTSIFGIVGVVFGVIKGFQ